MVRFENVSNCSENFKDDAGRPCPRHHALSGKLQEVQRREACLIRQLAELQEKNQVLTSRLEATSSTLRRALEERDEALVQKRKEVFCRQQLEKQMQDLIVNKNPVKEETKGTHEQDKTSQKDFKVLEALNSMARSLQGFQSILADALVQGGSTPPNSQEMQDRLSEPCSTMENSLLQLCRHLHVSEEESEDKSPKTGKNKQMTVRSRNPSDERPLSLHQPPDAARHGAQSQSLHTIGTQTQDFSEDTDVCNGGGGAPNRPQGRAMLSAAVSWKLGIPPLVLISSTTQRRRQQDKLTQTKSVESSSDTSSSSSSEGLRGHVRTAASLLPISDYDFRQVHDVLKQKPEILRSRTLSRAPDPKSKAVPTTCPAAKELPRTK
ncbi:hypothetical protein GUITHDRAFT_108814 [Guillardia theta CCMP2712]|uniref:Uncharacterized protein n=1 Tax=Guillardia theta (strain CCMP2712) TaxID=905079 RepID=L1JAP3_GUITC|nr:hypothetical protein GUITHDRAFT_108814 [Guillardia theta CCMP2712]EKX45169.1 hypothetical protein GUITHDRAFT_108814 [Guillardia theta CCMP2712]|eukprot:XP_005832149.1 hypothetical protein GUITHDRAFT_108814 [Guillardia theta CCMP2712]